MFDSEEIAKWISDNFNLRGDIKISHLRTYTNDVYEVQRDQKYLLKIYGENWRSKSEVLFEIGLLDYLNNRVVSVARPIAGKNGEKLFNISIAGKQRLAVMFEWAKGEKPKPPFTPNDYELLGKATASMHQAADSFKSHHQREELNIDYLIERPLIEILEFCQNDNKKRTFFNNFATQLITNIEEFKVKGLDYGVVHADITFDNIHITEEGNIIFYDFDSGGMGWRAIDLQGWAVFDPKTAIRQQAFIKGYRVVREISDNDILAAPYLHAANEFWGVELDLSTRINKQGKDAVDKYLLEKVETLESFKKYFDNHSKIQ